MIDNPLGWEAHWVESYDPWQRELVVMRRVPEGRELLIWRRRPFETTDNMMPISENWAIERVGHDVSFGHSTMIFPEGVAEAIITASAAAGESGRAAEVRVLREWIDRESYRVDHLTGLGQQVHLLAQEGPPPT